MSIRDMPRAVNKVGVGDYIQRQLCLQFGTGNTSAVFCDKLGKEAEFRLGKGI